MTEDETDDLAITLAEETAAKVSDPAIAAAVLYQASLTLMITHFPPDKVATLVHDMTQIALADVAEALGKEATRQ